MDIKELGPIGAELTDIDLKSLSNEDVARIKIYFLDHSVIVFKNQNLNPQDLKNISKLWGEALVHPVFKGIEGHPEIIEIKNLGEKYHTNAHWHSGGSAAWPALTKGLCCKSRPSRHTQWQLLCGQLLT